MCLLQSRELTTLFSKFTDFIVNTLQPIKFLWHDYTLIPEVAHWVQALNLKTFLVSITLRFLQANISYVLHIPVQNATSLFSKFTDFIVNALQSIKFLPLDFPNTEGSRTSSDIPLTAIPRVHHIKIHAVQHLIMRILQLRKPTAHFSKLIQFIVNNCSQESSWQMIPC